MARFPWGRFLSLGKVRRTGVSLPVESLEVCTVDGDEFL
jgi:hypothetical protein